MRDEVVLVEKIEEKAFVAGAGAASSVSSRNQPCPLAHVRRKERFPKGMKVLRTKRGAQASRGRVVSNQKKKKKLSTGIFRGKRAPPSLMCRA